MSYQTFFLSAACSSRSHRTIQPSQLHSPDPCSRAHGGSTASPSRGFQPFSLQSAVFRLKNAILVTSILGRSPIPLRPQLGETPAVDHHPSPSPSFVILLELYRHAEVAARGLGGTVGGGEAHHHVPGLHRALHRRQRNLDLTQALVSAR